MSHGRMRRKALATALTCAACQLANGSGRLSTWLCTLSDIFTVARGACEQACSLNARLMAFAVQEVVGCASFTSWHSS